MLVTSAFAQSSETTETHTQTGVADQAAGGVFPPFDSTTYTSQLLWLAITFGIFYFVVSRFIAPRIGSILETRRDRIAEDLDEANRLKEESDAAVAAYEQELAEARQKAAEIAQNSRDKAKAEAEAERLAVEEKLAARIAESEKHVADVKAKALSEVDNIAGDTAEFIVKQLIDAKITKAELSDAVKGAS